MRVSRRRMVIAGVLVLGTAVLMMSVVYLASPREPTYQGKTLSEWIAPFCKQTAKGLDAPGGPQHFEELQPSRRAVKEIGTNAIPFLNARLNHRESELHRTARQLLEKQPFAALRLTDPYTFENQGDPGVGESWGGGEASAPDTEGTTGRCDSLGACALCALGDGSGGDASVGKDHE